MKFGRVIGFLVSENGDANVRCTSVAEDAGGKEYLSNQPELRTQSKREQLGWVIDGLILSLPNNLEKHAAWTPPWRSMH